jgi:hypothetical protein
MRLRPDYCVEIEHREHRWLRRARLFRWVDRAVSFFLGATVLWIFTVLGRAAQHWDNWKWMVGR